MKNKTLISAAILLLFFVGLLFMYFTSPTKAEVERYFEENECISCSGEPYGEVYQLRRNTGMLFGQIFEIPTWFFPDFVLYITTPPFNYYHDISHSEDEFYTYTWIDTKEGRFVYNAVNGEYVKGIDDKENPSMKYHEEMRKEMEDLNKSFEY